MRLALALVTIASCKGKPSKPLPEAILGDWEVWCRTDKESSTTCLGKEREVMVKSFAPDGTIALSVKGRGDAPMRGHWTLANDELTLTFDGGGMHLVETYRARIDDDHLILWYARDGFGSILGRAGASFEAASSETSKGGRTSKTLGGVAYSIALPADYRLARDDNNRQSWEPVSGTGFVVELSVSPRGQTEIDGKFVTPPCNPRDYGGVSGSSETIKGVERKTSIGTSICLDHTELVLMCSTEHTRGYLEASENDAALALCKSVEVVR